ncbi:MAG: SUMF1/EgtB/PvdO family nonheme iron enzyme [Acidobacteriota bacterium]
MARDSYTRYPRPILWLVQGGTITLGGDEEDAQPCFEVEIDSFYISKLPVTNEQLEAGVPSFSRSPLSPGDREPAVGVTYAIAQAYCDWYAGVSRKPMRLPSEIEWEYACRAGASGRWFCAEEQEVFDAHVWHAGNAGDGERVPQLDAKKANDFGLYGMLGGLWEWTSSPYRPYPLTASAAEGEPADSAVSARVLRGGSFRVRGERISCSLRRAEQPSASDPDVGFRIVKSLR